MAFMWFHSPRPPDLSLRRPSPSLLPTKPRRLTSTSVDFLITYGNVKSARSKTLDGTIELANDLMDQKLRTYAERQSTGNTNVANTQKGNGAAPKGNGCFECGAPGHFKRDCPKLKNKDGGNGNAQGWVYAVGNAEKRGNASGNPDAKCLPQVRSLNNTMHLLYSDNGALEALIHCI
ncbi:putative reverse transcriptase domain-containing protein [Tanacetum coccineum]